MTTLVDIGRSFDGQRCPDCDLVMFLVNGSRVCHGCGQLAEPLLYGHAAVAAIADAFFELSEPAPKPGPVPTYEQGQLL